MQNGTGEPERHMDSAQLPRVSSVQTPKGRKAQSLPTDPLKNPLVLLCFHLKSGLPFNRSRYMTLVRERAGLNPAVILCFLTASLSYYSPIRQLPSPVQPCKWLLIIGQKLCALHFTVIAIFRCGNDEEKVLDMLDFHLPY